MLNKHVSLLSGNRLIPDKPRRGLMGFPSVPVPNPQITWKETADQPIEVPCAVYFHIPYCRSRCSFCNFYYGQASEAEIAEYAVLLEREIRKWGPEIRGTVNAVYFGGGSPGILMPEAIRRVLAAVQECVPLANDAEITWETRVEDLDDARLDAVLAGGVNRFSIGIQTFDTALRHALGRTSAKETVLETLSRLAGRNQAAVTVDLLYGLPGQTPEALANDFDTACGEAPLSGFSFYRLRVHTESLLAEQIRGGRMPALPSDEECFELYRLCGERMAAAGGRRISFKHYAFGTRERNCYNSVSAWKLPCIPFGVNAAGRLGQYRFKLTGTQKEYREAVERGVKPLAFAGLMPEDFSAASVIAGELSCRMMLHPAAVMERVPEPLAAPAAERLGASLERLVADGLMMGKQYGGYRLTERGCFRCPEVAGRLMEDLASVWKEDC